MGACSCHRQRVAQESHRKAGGRGRLGKTPPLAWLLPRAIAPRHTSKAAPGPRCLELGHLHQPPQQAPVALGPRLLRIYPQYHTQGCQGSFTCSGNAVALSWQWCKSHWTINYTKSYWGSYGHLRSVPCALGHRVVKQGWDLWVDICRLTRWCEAHQYVPAQVHFLVNPRLPPKLHPSCRMSNAHFYDRWTDAVHISHAQGAASKAQGRLELGTMTTLIIWVRCHILIAYCHKQIA